MRASGAIVGAAETKQLGQINMSELELHSEAAHLALADCGLSMSDVDGIATAVHSPVSVAHYLGMQPRWMDGTSVGGCSFLIHVRHAVAAIAQGLCETVLVIHGESGRSQLGRPRRVIEPHSAMGQFESPYGIAGAPTMFTMGVLRYMKYFGLTHEQLAEVAVAQREWAISNPRALRREPMSVEDVLASPLVAYPFHRPECCLVTDGGGALVITSSDRARGGEFPTTPVYVAGAGEAPEVPMISAMEDLTESRGFRLSSAAAFAEAQIGTEDVDHLMVYDAFAHLPLFGLEALGFVGKGEAGAFVAEGHTRPGGRLPMNTSGGGLSYTHTGMYGMFAILESVRQLRGEAAAQVSGAEVSVVQGVGGMFGAAATLVLSNSDS